MYTQETVSYVFRDFPLLAPNLKSIQEFPSPQPLVPISEMPTFGTSASVSHVSETCSSSKKTTSSKKKKESVTKRLLSLLDKSLQDNPNSENNATLLSLLTKSLQKDNTEVEVSDNESTASGPDPFTDVPDPLREYFGHDRGSTPNLSDG